MNMRLRENTDADRYPGADRRHQHSSGRHHTGSGGSGERASATLTPVAPSVAAGGGRSQVLEDMVSALDTRGVARIEIDGLARAAGSDPVAIRHLFGDLNGAIAEALRVAEEELAQELETALAGIPDSADKLSAVIQARVAETNWALWMQLDSRAVHDEALQAGRQDLEEVWRARLARIIRTGREDGAFDSVNADETAMMITSMIDGLCVPIALNDSKLTTNHVLQICLDACKRLLGARLELASSRN